MPVARGTHLTLLSVSVKAGNESLLWKVPSLHWEGEGLFITRDGEFRRRSSINKSCSLRNLLLQAQTLFGLLACTLSRHFCCVQLLVTLWTVTCQSPLSMGFSRQEYWSGLLFPFPGYLPDSGIKPASLKSPALAGKFLTAEPTREPI